MGSSSRPRRPGAALGAALAALALASMATPVARSQGEAPAAGEVPTSAAATAEGEPELDPVEIEIDDPLVAPGAMPVPDVDDPDARDQWLRVRLGALVGAQPGLARARIGVSVVDVATGEVLFEKAPGERFNLASNVKVLTAAAALARLGPDFRWRTAAYAEKWDLATGVVDGDLFLRGRGDPTLRAADLRALAHDLRQAGVREIRGRLVLDTSYFDDVVDPPHFDEQPKERAGFRAPVGALAIEGSTIVVVVEPDPAGIAPATVTIEPDPGDYVEVELADVSTVTTGRTRLRVETIVDKRKDRLRLRVTGQIRADGGPRWIRRRIDDPVRLVHEVMRGALADEGIRLARKKPARGAVPLEARLLAFHDSAPLGEIVRTMNKTSNNFIAETVLKTLGAETGPALGPAPRPATWADGLAALEGWLVGDAGLEAGGFRIGNGSGLFASSEVSPSQLTAALRAAWRDFRVGPDLAASMAVMGVDGTVRSRLAKTPARGRVRAKTGTLAAVSTLSGYVAVDGLRPLAFAVLVNDIPDGARGEARALQDQIVQACVAYLGGE